ncbi:hypothetical protein [Alteromonas sp. AMM-1]
MKSLTNPFSFNPFNPIIWHWPLSGDVIPIRIEDYPISNPLR